jgi:hypothetical protein
VYLSKGGSAVTTGFSRQRFGLGSNPEHYMWDLLEEKCSEKGCSSNIAVFIIHPIVDTYEKIKRGTEIVRIRGRNKTLV